MVGEVRDPCEVCIIKVNCSSKWDCPMKNNYNRYVVEKQWEKTELRRIKNQSVVDGYFKRFRRSR
jgi:hypothetical protein